MRITVPAFTGLNKLTAVQRLKDSEASEAVNCDFRSGDLRAFYDDKSAGVGGVTVSSGTAAATIFDYTSTQQLIASEDYGIVRSPVVNDLKKRVYFSRYPSSQASDFVRVIDSDMVSAGQNYLPGLPSKRLGVPQPANFLAPPTYIILKGDVSAYTVSTVDDSTFTTIASAAKNLVKGGKVIMNVGGFPTSALSITNLQTTGANTIVTLAGNKKVWKNCQSVQAVAVSGTTTKTYTTTLSFRFTGHGLSTGDQVIVARRSPDPWPSQFPQTGMENTVWTVTVIDVNNFTLQTLPSPTASTGTAGETTKNAKFALIASNAASLSSDAMANINVGYNGQTSQTTITVNPSSIPNLTLGQWADAATIDTVRSRSYCVTFVNSYGDESAPSAPTDPFDVAPGNPVTFIDANNVNVLPTTGKTLSLDQYTAISKVRLYRTDETGTFRLVTTEGNDADTITWAEATDPTFTYIDTKTDAHLGEPLVTTGWYPPPQGVNGIISAPNGVVIGFKERTIYPSVPYVPYAFPVAYQLATDADIMGLVATSSGVAVLTQQMPYLLTGTDPSGYSMVKLEVPQACVSHYSVVDMGSFGMYASPNGLVAINGAEIELVTADLLTRAQWQSYNPSSIIGGHSDGRYIGSYKGSDGVRRGFMFDTRTATFSDLSMGAFGFYNDLLNDVLKFIDTTGAIKLWNQDTTYKTFHWVSKAFELPKPNIFGIAQVVCPVVDFTQRSLTMKLWAWDGSAMVLIATFTNGTTDPANGIYPMANVVPFRLPTPADRYTAFKIELTGNAPVGMVSFANVMDELKEV